MKNVADLGSREIFVSKSATSARASRGVAAGRLRKLASRLYSNNLTEDPTALVRRHLWEIVAAYFPDALVADRTALELQPATDGSVFLVTARGRDIALPGVTLRVRRGVKPLPGDYPLRDGVLSMSTARALLENMRPSRARTGVARTLARTEIEAWLDRFLRHSGEERLNALRDEARMLAPKLRMEEATAELDSIIGTLLRSRDAALKAPAARARAGSRACDPERMALLETLRDALQRFPPEPLRHWLPEGDAAANQAFFEAYFSNFIEGTEFAVDEAKAIVFEGVIPRDRPADAHDILGTFRIVSDSREMKRVPTNEKSFLELLRRRHGTIMEGRPEALPGEFKQRANQFGTRIFVAPDEVEGTLARGLRLYQGLTDPLHRAIFMMFLVSEVHPFVDGNGHVARIMMNAELAAAGQMRVLIPIVYRSNYLAALRALSVNGWPEPIIRTLVYAQRYAAAIPWRDFDLTVRVLRRTNALIRPEVGDDEGIRLRIPDAADLAGEERPRPRN